jgi:hypothetical protein
MRAQVRKHKLNMEKRNWDRLGYWDYFGSCQQGHFFSRRNEYVGQIDPVMEVT